MPEEFVVPEEERVTKAAHSDAYLDLIRRLSHQSVVKHFDAYADIDWDNPEFRIDHDDPRWELEPDDVLGATEWYRSQPAGIRSRIGLRMLANFMKIGVIFEYVLKRGLLEFAAQLPTGSPEFRYCYHETIEEAQHSLMFQEFINRTGFNLPGLGRLERRCADFVVKYSRKFPELFFVFVLAGEDPIDYVQRQSLRKNREDIHPLFRRIMQIHVTEEARHMSFARHALRKRVPALRGSRRCAAGTLRAYNPRRHGQDDDGGVAADRARIQYPARSRGRRLSQESDSPRAHARSFEPSCLACATSWVW